MGAFQQASPELSAFAPLPIVNWGQTLQGFWVSALSGVVAFRYTEKQTVPDGVSSN